MPDAPLLTNGFGRDIPFHTIEFGRGFPLRSLAVGRIDPRIGHPIRTPRTIHPHIRNPLRQACRHPRRPLRQTHRSYRPAPGDEWRSHKTARQNRPLLSRRAREAAKFRSTGLGPGCRIRRDGGGSPSSRRQPKGAMRARTGGVARDGRARKDRMPPRTTEGNRRGSADVLMASATRPRAKRQSGIVTFAFVHRGCVLT